MSTVLMFESTDKVRMVCECGTMEGKVETAAFGRRYFFRCGYCHTFVLMEVTQ